MSGVGIGDATLTTPAGADWIPFARSGDTTARRMTVSSLASYANAYDLRNYGTTATAFATACAAAIADGKPLYVPAGTYDFSDIASAVTVDGVLTIYGDGIGVTTLQGGAAADLFAVDGGSLTVDGLEFDTWDDVINLDATTATVPYLRVFNCRFDTVDNGIYWYDLTSSYDLNEVRVQGCEFVTCTTDGIMLGIPDILRAWITDNYFESCGYRGIWFGGGNDEDTAGHAHICNNTFKTIGVSDSRTEVHAIIAFREYLDISNNHIDTVLSGASDDWEAIYVKSRYSTISHNTINAGGLVGIIVKGALRGGGSPTGGIVEAYGNVVSDNVIVGGGYGIQTAKVDDVLIVNNYCEAQTTAGISITAGSHHKVHNNTVRLCTGVASIAIGAGAAAISDITISNNSIDGQTYGSPSPAGIRFAENTYTISGVKIVGNTIRDVDGSTATGFGIDFQIGQTMDYCLIKGNVFIDLDYGVRFDTADHTLVHLLDNIFQSSVSTGLVSWTSVATRVSKNNTGLANTGVTFTDQDTTPSVASQDGFYVASNTVATTITNFDNGYVGQTITIVAANANTTIQYNGSVRLVGAGNYAMGAGDILVMHKYTGGDWREISRAVVPL